LVIEWNQREVTDMNLELSEEEREALSNVIKIYLSDLREEIYKTESHTFKPPLKKEKEILVALQERL
jgi:hypothetical protein